MDEKILALDMGGTSVKARMYEDGRVEKTTKWEHNYRDCGLENAKEDLVDRINSFCDCGLDAIGLGIAGLIATDNSLYRSTVLTSFVGFNLPDFLRKEFNVKAVSIDNDADCGAISEFNFREEHERYAPLFYFVVGSGIGSAYINGSRSLPYKVRLEPEHKFSEKDNPIPNDVGLQLPIPKNYIYEIFKRYNVPKNDVEKFLVDENGEQLKGPNQEKSSVRASVFGSTTSLKRILNIYLKSRSGIDLVTWRRLYEAECRKFCYQHHFEIPEEYREVDLDVLTNERKTSEFMGFLASYKDSTALDAFKIFGCFLGYSIAEAQKIVKKEQKLEGYPRAHLKGVIIKSFPFFEKSLFETVKERKVKCDFNTGPQLSLDLEGANLRGAYLQASKLLK